MSDELASSLSLDYVESLLAEYLRDPEAVPEDWRDYFGALDGNGTKARFRKGPSFPPGRLFGGGDRAQRRRIGEEARLLQHKVDEMVRTFRVRGHQAAQLDPIVGKSFPDYLEAAAFGLDVEDFSEKVSTVNLPGKDVQTVGELYQRMRDTYCGAIGAEFMHIDDFAVRSWLQERMEVNRNRIELTRDVQLRILRRLTAASVFEQFIQKKYLGAKSFSLEGAESLIPLLDLAIEKAAESGVREIVLGMAHRGRLNVLHNILGKSPKFIFQEFEDSYPEETIGSGDVKYHLGYSSDWKTASGVGVHLTLSFNPSHLEFINTVAQGRARAKQDHKQDAERRSAAVFLIHGDAAFAGEGIVQETLNLSGLEGYNVGGTVHVVVNNQIGFTTSPSQGRSNRYATDIAKMLQIPIFHVNGEQPEAVAQVVAIALDFRARYRRDVVIDMYCYRRRGHNEGDEPAFTQPQLYKSIRERQPVRVHYSQHLLDLGGITESEVNELQQSEEGQLEEALRAAREESTKQEPQAYGGIWMGYVGGHESAVPDAETRLDPERAKFLLSGLLSMPQGFRPHRKIERILEHRREMADGERPLDWATAECMAFASLAAEGTRVRFTGQDSERGTFSQRHAVLHDVESGERYCPLEHLSEAQAPVEITNSPLSEAGVLGFEYGYSLDSPDALVVWEAQFGDFCNAAQVVIDQFITSAEDKWHRLSGITLLLPHGFEGQGPEHSSARLERWLTLAAEDNIQVVYPTTPAQYFHLLRRQVLRPLRKPLIVMTPKSLLRHEKVVSKLEDLASGTFQRVIPDHAAAKRKSKIQRVLVCSGKIYYDLTQWADQLDNEEVAIVRLEQLYPLPLDELRAALKPYRKGTPVYWVQEEPRNMGAWSYLRLNLESPLFGRHPFAGIYRPESASPATGSAHSHRLEQTRLLAKAFSYEGP